MFKRLFKKIRKFFKKFFAEGGTFDKVEHFLTNETERLDHILKATNNILLIANNSLDKLEDIGFEVPHKVQEAIKQAVQEVGYWDDSINGDDGFKSVVIAIARRINGTKAHKEGVVQNIARYTLVKMFPELNKKEASDIMSLAITLLTKKKNK
jgi:hypothetical protein